MKKALKVAGIGLAIAVVLVVAGFFAWTRVTRYPAFPDAVTLAQEAKSDRGWYVFEPATEPTEAVVFYPGGLVDPAAYAPLMKRLSDGGVLAVIVPMTLDLAVFGTGRADDVIAAYPSIQTWAISGHSLGGAMAAEYAKSHSEEIDGIAFLASYPAESTDLSGLPLQALSIYGTKDGVAGTTFQESLQRLPAGTRLIAIEGGNHAQFGDYGPQRGDGTASISREEQQRQTADAILGFLRGLE